MYFNKASPPLNTSVQWRFCLRQAVFFDFNKNFLYNIYVSKKRILQKIYKERSAVNAKIGYYVRENA